MATYGARYELFLSGRHYYFALASCDFLCLYFFTTGSECGSGHGRFAADRRDRSCRMLHLDLAAEANPLAATPADISSLQSWMMLPEIADNFALTAEAMQFIAQR
jgi:hypothetical protein